MVRGAKFDDSNVPVHVPATFTAAGTGPGEEGGAGEGLEELLPLQLRFKARPSNTHGNPNEPMEQFFIASCLDVAGGSDRLPERRRFGVIENSPNADGHAIGVGGSLLACQQFGHAAAQYDAVSCEMAVARLRHFMVLRCLFRVGWRWSHSSS
jgi:hypothetical protein